MADNNKQYWRKQHPADINAVKVVSLSTPSRKLIATGLLLIALTLLAYAPVLRGGFIWDDDDYVTENPNLRSFAGLIDTWTALRSSPQYYPMVFTTFWIEYQMWDLNPVGYHLVNILLHATAAILLWRVLVMLDVPAPLLAAGIFALHPVQVESVAWVTERKNVLSMVFYLAAALSYVAWASRPSDRGHAALRKRSGKTPEPRSNLYALSLFLFVAALLSKTVTCSLPAALLLVIWWKHGRITRRDVASLAPFLVIGVALAITTVWLERSHVRAVGAEWALSPINRLLVAGRAVWFYAGKLILPIDLSFIYPKWTIDPHVAWQWAFPLGVIVALLVLFLMRSRWGRGPLVGALLFVGTLVPALGFFNIYPMRYSFVADHFQYHASIGLIVLIGVGLQRMIGRGAWVVPVVLFLMTMSRAAIFNDVERLWRDTLEKNPNSWMVNLNLAKVLALRDRLEEAVPYFERQVELAPHLPETHWNLGVSLSRRGKLDEALAEYDRALERDSKCFQAWFGRGNVFVTKGAIAQAKVEYGRAIESNPDYAQAHNELGQLLVREKQYIAAMEHYIRAIECDPNLAKAHLNLAYLLSAMGRTKEARQELNEAIRLDPSLKQFSNKVLGTQVSPLP